MISQKTGKDNQHIEFQAEASSSEEEIAGSNP